MTPARTSPAARRPARSPATVTNSRAARRAASTHQQPYRTADMPLAIWACAQRTSQWQRHDRYVRESHRHPAKMLPALARKAIETYSDPGQLVLDPMCGIGTTLVEAIHLDRQALGVELEPRWADLARANLHAARQQGAHASARVLDGDAHALPALLARAGHAAVDLVLTSPPYACNIADVSSENLARKTGPLRRSDTNNYSADRSNLGYARGETYLSAMQSVYDACAQVLKPGGFLVVVTKDMRDAGALRDLSGDTIALCRAAGLCYWQRIVALLASVRDDQIVMRPSLWQTLAVRRARARGERTHVVAHEDVLVFRAPLKPARRRAQA